MYGVEGVCSGLRGGGVGVAVCRGGAGVVGVEGCVCRGWRECGRG